MFSHVAATLHVKSYTRSGVPASVELRPPFAVNPKLSKALPAKAALNNYSFADRVLWKSHLGKMFLVTIKTAGYIRTRIFSDLLEKQ